MWGSAPGEHLQGQEGQSNISFAEVASQVGTYTGARMAQ